MQDVLSMFDRCEGQKMQEIIWQAAASIRRKSKATSYAAAKLGTAGNFVVE